MSEDFKCEYEFYLEKNVIVLTRDNKYYSGILKSFDQFNSITLNFSVERIFLDKEYAEKRCGLLVIRGESIVYIGLGSFNTFDLKKVNYNKLIKIFENYETL